MSGDGRLQATPWGPLEKHELLRLTELNCQRPQGGCMAHEQRLGIERSHRRAPIQSRQSPTGCKPGRIHAWELIPSVCLPPKATYPARGKEVQAAVPNHQEPTRASLPPDLHPSAGPACHFAPSPPVPRSLGSPLPRRDPEWWPHQLPHSSAGGNGKLKGDPVASWKGTPSNPPRDRASRPTQPPSQDHHNNRVRWRPGRGESRGGPGRAPGRPSAARG